MRRPLLGQNPFTLRLTLLDKNGDRFNGIDLRCHINEPDSSPSAIRIMQRFFDDVRKYAQSVGTSLTYMNNEEIKKYLKG